jgi:hypothetical protein
MKNILFYSIISLFFIQHVFCQEQYVINHSKQSIAIFPLLTIEVNVSKLNVSEEYYAHLGIIAKLSPQDEKFMQELKNQFPDYAITYLLAHYGSNFIIQLFKDSPSILAYQTPSGPAITTHIYLNKDQFEQFQQNAEFYQIQTDLNYSYKSEQVLESKNIDKNVCRKLAREETSMQKMLKSYHQYLSSLSLKDFKYPETYQLYSDQILEVCLSTEQNGMFTSFQELMNAKVKMKNLLEPVSIKFIQTKLVTTKHTPQIRLSVKELK